MLINYGTELTLELVFVCVCAEKGLYVATYGVHMLEFGCICPISWYNILHTERVHA